MRKRFLLLPVSGENEYQTPDGSSATQLANQQPTPWYRPCQCLMPCRTDTALLCCSGNVWLSLIIYCINDKIIIDLQSYRDRMRGGVWPFLPDCEVFHYFLFYRGKEKKVLTSLWEFGLCVGLILLTKQKTGGTWRLGRFKTLIGVLGVSKIWGNSCERESLY